jgi:hypothetical protein
LGENSPGWRFEKSKHEVAIKKQFVRYAFAELRHAVDSSPFFFLLVGVRRCSGDFMLVFLGISVEGVDEALRAQRFFYAAWVLLCFESLRILRNIFSYL